MSLDGDKRSEKSLIDQNKTRLVIVMKIDPTSISPVSSVQAASRISSVNRNHKNAEHDKVAVSENAQVFQRLVQKAKELPETREDKVKAIAEQIKRGEFNLDSDSIAASILSLGVKGEK